MAAGYSYFIIILHFVIKKVPFEGFLNTSGGLQEIEGKQIFQRVILPAHKIIYWFKI